MKLLLDDHRLHSLLYLRAQTVAAASNLNLANNQCTFTQPTLLISLQKVLFCCSIDSKVAAFVKEPPLFFNSGDSQKTTSADLITASAPSAQDDGDVT